MNWIVLTANFISGSLCYWSGWFMARRTYKKDDK